MSPSVIQCCCKISNFKVSDPVLNRLQQFQVFKAVLGTYGSPIGMCCQSSSTYLSVSPCCFSHTYLFVAHIPQTAGHYFGEVLKTFHGHFGLNNIESGLCLFCFSSSQELFKCSSEKLSNNLIGCPDFGCVFSHTNVKIAWSFLAYRHLHSMWSG